MYLSCCVFEGQDFRSIAFLFQRVATVADGPLVFNCLITGFGQGSLTFKRLVRIRLTAPLDDKTSVTWPKIDPTK